MPCKAGLNLQKCLSDDRMLSIPCYISMNRLSYDHCQELEALRLYSSKSKYCVVRDLPMYETDADIDEVLIRRVECEECDEVKACMYILHPECDTLRWICPGCIAELRPECQ